jgi:hypothetical protein
MNRPGWKLLVEGLGKIERAEVEVHPLMLFVGDNNSGKSYLASVLWGLLAMPRAMPLPEGPTLTACEAWLDARRAERSLYGLSAEDHVMFTRLFNEMFGRDDVFVKWVFNSPIMTAARVEIEPLHHRDVMLAWEPGFQVDDRRLDFLFVREDFLNDPQSQKIYRELLLRQIASQVALGLPGDFGRRDSGVYKAGWPMFLPASRSGFMLLYQAAARRGFEQAVQPATTGESWLKMTQPTYQFIDRKRSPPRPPDRVHVPERSLACKRRLDA